MWMCNHKNPEELAYTFDKSGSLLVNEATQVAQDIISLYFPLIFSLTILQLIDYLLFASLSHLHGFSVLEP